MRGLRVLLVGALAALGFSVVSSSPAAASISVDGFDQCQNQSPAPYTTCNNWTNGGLNNSNHYAEDMVVPQRAVFTVTDTADYTFSTTYDDLNGTRHGYDYLARYNYSITGASPCLGLTASWCSGAPSTFNMASDPATRGSTPAGISNVVSAHELAQADRVWTLYGGVITATSVPSHTSNQATVTVTFHANPGVTKLVLLYGGHLAVGGPNTAPRAWGAGNGASSYPGGSLSIGVTGSSRNNGIQTNAIAPLPAAAFTVTKTATPANPAPGQSVTYVVTVTNTGGQPGTTTFTDDYDNRLTPSTAVSSPAGNNCAPGAGVFTCATGTINPTASQTFTYTATMPSSFSGGAGTGGCAANTYPVTNTATITGGNATVGSSPASRTVCVSAAAQFSVTKTATPANPGPGQSVDYVVTVTNNGSAAGSTSFTDDYDNRLSPSTAVSNPAGNNCAPSNGTFTCTTGTIPAGGNQTFSYSATMPASFDGGAGTGGCGPGTYPVTNAVSGAAGTTSKTVCVGAAPSFSVTKSVDDATVSPGDLVTYTITVTNNGNASGSTSFTDDYDNRLTPSTAASIPAGNDCAPGAGVFSCTTGTIQAGQSQQFVYTASMPLTFSGPSGGGGCDTGSYPVTNSVSGAAGTASKTVCVGASANFVIGKVVDDDTPAPGQTVHYTVTVTNTGSAPGSTSFTDDYTDSLNPTLPTGSPTGSCSAGSGSFTCTTGTVPAGDHVTFTYSATVPTAFGPLSGGEGCDTGSYPLSNTATLGDGPADGVTLCVAAAPSYTIEKSVDDPTGLPNQVVTYTVTVHNNGTAAGATSFTDDFDDRLTPGPVTITPNSGSCSIAGATNLVLECDTGIIAPGGQQTFSYTVTLPATYSGEDGVAPCGPGGYRIANVATLDASNAQPAITVVCVSAAPSFVVNKSVDDSSPEPGQAVTYTVQVTNNGTAAGSTTWTDDFDDRLSPSTAVPTPAGNNCVPGAGSFSCTTGTIPALGSQTFTYTATMPATFSGPGGGGDCQPGSYRVANTASTGTSSETVELCVAAAPDFEVTKSVDDAGVEPGDTVTYTITVENTGDASGSTTFTDDYDNRLTPSTAVSNPAGNDCAPGNGTYSCTTGTIAAGGSQLFVYTATVPETFTGDSGTGDCGPGTFRIANEVSVTGSSASQDVCVTAAPDFEVSKSVDDATVDPGDTVTYAVTVTNTGDASGSTSFTDDYDNRLVPSPVTSDPPGVSCTDDGDVVSCDTGTILAGESQTFTYSAVVPSTFTGPSGGGDCQPGSFRISNDVEVDGSADSQDVCVAAEADLTVTKIASTGTAAPGQTVTYTITVANEGSAPGSTSLDDDYDDRVTPGPVTINPNPGSCDDQGGVLHCVTAAIDPDASQTFSYDVTLPETFSGPTGGHDCADDEYAVFNGVALASGNEDGATVCVDADAEFTLEKSADPAAAAPGATVTYTIVVTNNGTADGSTPFTDDYDNRLSPSTAVSNPAGNDCAPGTGVFHCSTGTIPAGESQTFTYTATMPETFGTHDGTGGCVNGEFPVENNASIDDGPGDGATVCVDADPHLTIAKSASPENAAPGQTVTYTIVVGNDGTAAGSTTFTDDYDDRLSPSAVTSDPTGADCQPGNGSFTCATGTIPAGGSQTFTYTATMPASFTGLSGGGGCPDGSYPVTNTAALNAETADGARVCVAAAPAVTLEKSSKVEFAPNGDQQLTYTLRWTNTGPGEAVNVVVTDPIPTSTAFVSCDDCTVSGSTATWNVGSIAPLGGTDTATLVVKVTSSQACSVSNTAQLRIGSGSPISSNTVTDNVSPVANPAGAHANGSAIGIQIKANGLLSLITGLVNVITSNNSTGTISQASSSQSGVGFSADDDSLLSIKVPSKGSILSAEAIAVTSASSVTAAPPEARQTSTSEIAHVCLVPISGVCTVEANAIRAVASTMANGQFATGGSAGSTIANLKVVGLGTPVDLNQTTLITLNPGIFGKNSYVAIGERNATVSGAGGKYSADSTVTMIHLKITGALGVQAVELSVAQAKAHSDFPKTIQCSGPRGAVSGHAYNALLYTGPLVADLLQGFVMISPMGGDSRQQVVALSLPANGSIAGAQVADSRSTGVLSPTQSTARSFAEIAGDGTKPACVLRTGASCIVNATAIRSEARSVANENNSTSTDTGSQLLGVSVLGIPIAAQPPPNSTIKLPGIGFIILNEQFCDNGTNTNTHSCVGVPHSGITVRSLRVVITVANNILGLDPGVELVVSEAHADASFS